MLKYLDEITKGKRLDRGNLTAFTTWRRKKVGCLWELWGALQVDLDSSFARFVLCCLVFLLTSQDFLLTLGLSHMLNAHMNTLLDDASIDQFVDTDSDSRLGHVEDDTCASMVSLVGHTLVDRRIGENVDIVTHLDAHQVLRHMNRSMLSVLLGEHVARTRPNSE
jgi:hypothetical protein